MESADVLIDNGRKEAGGDGTAVERIKKQQSSKRSMPWKEMVQKRTKGPNMSTSGMRTSTRRSMTKSKRMIWTGRRKRLRPSVSG